MGKSREGQEQGIDGRVEKDELRKTDWGHIVKTTPDLTKGPGNVSHRWDQYLR